MRINIYYLGVIKINIFPNVGTLDNNSTTLPMTQMYAKCNI